MHAASLDSLPPAPPDSQERLVCVCEIERSARLHTREIRYTSEPGGERTAVSVSFEEASAAWGRRSPAAHPAAVLSSAECNNLTPCLLQDLSFHVGHADRAQHLKLVLFRPSDGSRVYVAAGSLGLEPLLHSDAAQRHSVSVPVVDEASALAGAQVWIRGRPELSDAERWATDPSPSCCSRWRAGGQACGRGRAHAAFGGGSGSGAGGGGSRTGCGEPS